ncbi:hypothetical protein Lal_00022794 [Lupinus albus]|nr:hypothetical protein Lal_00022794 [Lupinus albus]
MLKISLVPTRFATNFVALLSILAKKYVVRALYYGENPRFWVLEEMLDIVKLSKPIDSHIHKNIHIAGYRLNPACRFEFKLIREMSISKDFQLDFEHKLRILRL